jgi:hypothetical protein
MQRLAVLGAVGVAIVAVVVTALSLTRYEYSPGGLGQRDRLDRWTGEEAICLPHGRCIPTPKTCGDCGNPTPPDPSSAS